MLNFTEKVNFIESIANLLRGRYKQSEYGKIILPFTVLKRLDSVLVKTKSDVLSEYEASKNKLSEEGLDTLLKSVSGQQLYNTSKFTFENLKDDPNNLAANLIHYINSFSKNAKEIMKKFKFQTFINELDDSDLLFLVFSEFRDNVDLHPDSVKNLEMGYIFEELIRRFSEQSNETAGEHFTPREVIHLIVNLLFIEDHKLLDQKGLIKTIYDPACGTGGMLSVAEEYLRELNPAMNLIVFGQEINPESFAICQSDMLIKGQKLENIAYGDSFSKDQFKIESFDYMLCNPPFGVDWKYAKIFIENEFKKLGFAGRFGAGLPRINDGQLLFLQHMISKMKHNGKGTRIGIIFNGSPLYTGSANSGESEIRKWIINNDWLEAIIALPDQLFYNTGIFTYIWILTNRKSEKRKGKIQLINAIHFFDRMDKSLGNKRNLINNKQILKITEIYKEFKESYNSKIFDNDDFGHQEITINRPLRLNFKLTLERIQQIPLDTKFVNLSKNQNQNTAVKKDGEIIQDKIINSLIKLMEIDSNLYKNRERFTKMILSRFKYDNINISNNALKGIIISLSERDNTADICTDSIGNPESDSELNFTEIIPLNTDIEDYFKEEVLPYYQDSWINKENIKIGFDVLFTKYFYETKNLRSLEDITKEISRLESETKILISQLFSEDISSLTKNKDINNKWFDKIPNSWELRKLKFIADVNSSNVDKKTKENEKPVRLCNYTDVYYNDYITEDLDFMNATATEKEIKKFTLKQGDIIITKDSETPLDIAVPAYVQKSLPDVICGYHLTMLRSCPKIILDEYLFRTLQSEPIAHQFRASAKGITRYGLTLNSIENVLITLPPLTNQRKIIDFINTKVSYIDSIKIKLEQQINLIYEYRKTLITNIATGKVEIKE